MDILKRSDLKFQLVKQVLRKYQRIRQRLVNTAAMSSYLFMMSILQTVYHRNLRFQPGRLQGQTSMTIEHFLAVSYLQKSDHECYLVQFTLETYFRSFTRTVPICFDDEAAKLSDFWKTHLLVFLSSRVNRVTAPPTKNKISHLFVSIKCQNQSS